jgi:hypothetical protein
MSTDTFFRFRNQFGTFCRVVFALVEWIIAIRCMTLPGCCQNNHLNYASTRTTVSLKIFDVSYIVYFTTLCVLCCCIPGSRPTVTHMDIVMNVDTPVVRSCGSASPRICRLTSTSSLSGCAHAFLREYHAELSRQRCFEALLFKFNKTVKLEALTRWLFSSSLRTFVVVVVKKDVHRETMIGQKLTKCSSIWIAMLNGRRSQSDQCIM